MSKLTTKIKKEICFDEKTNSLSSAFRTFGGQSNDSYAIYPEDTDFKALVLDWAKQMNAKE